MLTAFLTEHISRDHFWLTDRLCFLLGERVPGNYCLETLAPALKMGRGFLSAPSAETFPFCKETP